MAGRNSAEKVETEVEAETEEKKSGAETEINLHSNSGVKRRGEEAGKMKEAGVGRSKVEAGKMSGAKTDQSYPSKRMREGAGKSKGAEAERRPGVEVRIYAGAKAGKELGTKVVKQSEQETRILSWTTSVQYQAILKKKTGDI